MRYPVVGAPMPDPLAREAVRVGLHTIEQFVKRLTNGHHDTYLLDHCQIAPEFLGAVSRYAPDFFEELKRVCGQTPQTDAAADDAIRRILDKSASDGFACRRWFGMIQGGKRTDLDGGTPVISYKGQVTPARRLLWQLKYPEGHPNHLLNHERLRCKRDICYVRSRCMNLDHWYKGTHYIDEQVAKAETMGDTRICRNGHRIDSTYRTCPYCRRLEPVKRQQRYAMTAALGDRLRSRRPQNQRYERPGAISSS